MFKSVYSRMLWTYLVIVLAAMLVLGVLVGELFRSQYESSLVSTMVREAEEINTIVSDKYYSGENRALAITELQVIARKYGAYVWIIDDSSGILRVNDPQKEREWAENTDFHLQDSWDDVVKNGKVIRTTGFFGDAFGVPVMTIARPLYLDGRIRGAIYLHTKMDDIQESVSTIYQNVFTCAIIGILLAVVLVPLTARTFTKPLVIMNNVAKSYAKGDFSSRVPVKSNDEIGQLANSFNQMAMELKSLDDLRRTFVANASHEMKAPLASMRGFLEAVLDGSVPEGEQREYLSIVLDETKRLSNLVTNLLDLSKIESGNFPMTKKVFDINEHIRRTLITFETRIDGKGLNVEADFREDSCPVFADPDHISQVLRNLIDNAIKFTPQGGTIAVSTRAKDGKAWVAVSDTGKGIPEEDLTQIWERFYKVEKAHTPGSDGTGLGLSIVQKIIEQHGEDITVESTPGKGTTFTFTLPLASRKLLRARENA
jgi:signal transduction histidine kinase